MIEFPKEFAPILKKIGIPFKKRIKYVYDGEDKRGEILDRLCHLEVKEKFAPDLLNFFIRFTDTEKIKKLLQIK